MKSIRIKTLLFFFLFFLTCAYADSSVYAQNESESPLHELPRADHCAVITINIREVSFSREGVLKEISLLETPVHVASESNEYYEQQRNEYEKRMKLLQERVSSLQEQIDLKEQQLENCLQDPSTPAAQKD